MRSSGAYSRVMGRPTHTCAPRWHAGQACGRLTSTAQASSKSAHVRCPVHRCLTKQPATHTRVRRDPCCARLPPSHQRRAHQGQHDWRQQPGSHIGREGSWWVTTLSKVEGLAGHTSSDEWGMPCGASAATVLSEALPCMQQCSWAALRCLPRHQPTVEHAKGCAGADCNDACIGVDGPASGIQPQAHHQIAQDADGDGGQQDALQRRRHSEHASSMPEVQQLDCVSAKGVCTAVPDRSKQRFLDRSWQQLPSAHQPRTCDTRVGR